MSLAAVLSDGRTPLSHPLVMHLLLTTKCNASCPGCRYSGGGDELNVAWCKRIISEFSRGGGKTVALGGGEPTIFPGIQEVVNHCRDKSLFVSMTTNGLFPKEVYGLNLVHVSRDSRHPLSDEQAGKAMDFYRGLGAGVGVNVVLWENHDLDLVMGFADHCAVTMILPKPWWVEPVDRKEVMDVARHPNVSADSCLATWLCEGGEQVFRTPCLQGMVSMCIDATGYASVCSHCPSSLKVKVDNVKQAWEDIPRMCCGWERSSLKDCLRKWHGVGDE